MRFCFPRWPLFLHRKLFVNIFFHSHDLSNFLPKKKIQVNMHLLCAEWLTRALIYTMKQLVLFILNPYHNLSIFDNEETTGAKII